MPTDPAAQPTPHAAAGPERRRHVRHAVEGVFTALGVVRDISASGMRVRARAVPPLEPGDRFRLEVKDGPHVWLFPARLIDARPTDPSDSGETDLGLAFGELTPDQQRSVDEIARRGPVLDDLTAGWQPEPDDERDDEHHHPDHHDDIYSAHDSFAGLLIDAGGGRDGGDTHSAADALDQLAATAAQYVGLVESVEASDPIDADPPEPTTIAAAPDRDGGGPDADHQAGAQRSNELAPVRPETAVTARMAAIEDREDDEEENAHPANPARTNQRRAGRLAAEETTTPLGRVLDISAGGLRVRRKGAAPVKVGQAFMIDLSASGRVLRAPVEVVRIDKVGWRTYDYGLRFGDLGDDIRAEFGRFVRMVSTYSGLV